MTKFIPYPFYYDDMPIDISFVFENEKPAGKHGFLKTEGRKFVFEDGTEARFWGTNFNGSACFPDHDYSEKVAKRLSKTGINRSYQLHSALPFAVIPRFLFLALQSPCLFLLISFVFSPY